MSSLPGRRVGMAILRIELDDAVGDRVLIGVRTVQDVTVDRRDARERSFASSEQALVYLSDWLNDWPQRPPDARGARR